jgi:hypothetical protein
VRILGRQERKTVIEPGQALEGLGLAAPAQHLPVDVSGEGVQVQRDSGVTRAVRTERALCRPKNLQ